MSLFQTSALIQLIRQSDILLQARRCDGCARGSVVQWVNKKRNLLEVRFFVDQRFRRLELDILLKDHDVQHC